MSDAEWKPAYIAGDEFARYLAAHSAVLQCTVCKSKSWNLLDDDRNLGVVIDLHARNPETEPARNLPVILLACKNCGNLQSFARRPVQDWLAATPKKEGG